MSWIYWDPNKEAFTLPFLNLPIAWYGILFAGGFVAGYFLLLPVLRKFFDQNRKLYTRDISDWAKLAGNIKSSALVKTLTSAERQALNDITPNEHPPIHLQEKLIDIVNSEGVSRLEIQKKFPEAIVPAQTLSTKFADMLTWYVVIGTVLGARLGHVIFYEWPYYAAHPWEILMIRNGGLASHGGTLGVMVGLVLFLAFNRKKFPEITFIRLMDLLVIPTALTVCCIRLGNFVNQEIIGTPTTLPWGIIFGHPVDGGPTIPRHPTQLYEALIYLGTFFLLLSMWRKWGTELKSGTYCGFFFILVFGSRFFIEYLKGPQSMVIDESYLQMSQYLSLPFVLLGVLLLAYARKCGSCKM